MKNIKKIFYIIIIAFVGFWFLYIISIDNPNPGDGENKTFIVEKGMGVSAIAEKLEDEGFLASPFMFKVYVSLNDYKTEFYDGAFNLQTDMNIKQLVKNLTEREPTPLRQELEVKIIEGWTEAEIDAYLAELGFIEPGELLKYSREFDEKNRFFLIDRPKGATLEGYLYPDTYRVFVDSPISALVAKMLNNFDNKLTEEIREEIKRQGKTLYEVLTLASVVEQEMYGYENRRKVAGVFLNRLEIGMPLQSDATVNYITQKGTDRPSIADTKIDNPYNTYQNQGLPPGPICNPSIEAIEAVVYPNITGDLYFLTTRDGQIFFSPTHEEHVRKKQLYLN